MASSAARVSLPTRRMRAKGFRRIAWTQAALPKMMPPCVAPIELVGAGGDKVGPGWIDPGSVGPPSTPSGRGRERPGPHVVDERQVAGMGDLAPTRPRGLRP